MSMKLLFGIAAAALLSTVSTTAFSLELRYNKWLPPSHHIDAKVLKNYFDEIEKVTEGRVTVKPTNSSLGSIERQYELVATGVADIVFMSESLTPGQFPLAAIVEMPGLGEDIEAVSVGYWRTYETYFEPVSPYSKVHLLGLATLAPYHIYTSSKAVASIEDMQGLKLRAAGVLPNEKVEALGGTVVPAQVTQFLEMMSKGVIDGAYSNDDSMYSFRSLDKIRHKTQFEGGLGGMSAAVMMNKVKWDEISAEDQARITAISGEKLAREMGRSFNESVAEAQAAIDEAGIKTTVADAAFMAAVRERLAPIEKAFIDDAAKVGVDGAAALKMMHDEVSSYQK